VFHFKNVFRIPGFVVVQAVMSWNIRPVAMLSILAAKTIKPQY